MRCGRGEGGEEGDPLMPALYACGQHRALVHVSEELLDSERLFAFMDDVYVCCGPDRVAAIHQLLGEMWDRARIQLHQGKTQFWNRGGTSPRGWEAMTAVARVGDPTAVLWKGDSSLPPSEQGLRILGTPLWHPENQLQRVSASHRLLELGSQQSKIFSRPGCCSCTAREPGKLPLEGHSTGTGCGVRHQPYSLSAGVFDKDLGCRSPLGVVGSC